jgi:hypothetical protein
VRQVRFFDRCIGPDGGEQLVLVHQPSMMLDQHAKRVEHLRAQRHGIAVVRETSLADFEPVGPELVHAARQGLMAFSEKPQKN